MKKNPYCKILKRESKEQHLSTIPKSCFFYYKLHLGSRMCKVMVVKSDCPIMIGKLQLIVKMCKGIMHYFIHQC